MADIQRQAIEQLMGLETRGGRPSTSTTMSSPRVCKLFLVGYCPHDLFVSTKQDLGKCPKLHLERHRLEYQERVAKGEKFPEFEYDYYMNLRLYVNDLDTQISIAHKRLEHTPEEKAKVADAMRDLDVADLRVALMAQELDALVSNGDYVRALHQTQALNAEQAKRQKLQDHVQSVIDNITQLSQQKLQVCGGCGAYLSQLDSDERLAFHFMGKIHLGYVQMRQAYNQLLRKYKNRS